MFITKHILYAAWKKGKDKMIELHKAEEITRELIDILNPLCDRIEVAGSVRRKKPTVKDIELVIIPKAQKETDDLFSEQEKVTYHIDKFLWEDPRFDFRLSKDGKRMYGDKNKLLLFTSEKYGQIALDIFTAEPHNYMMVKFIRTGGAKTNKLIAVTANKLGYNLRIYESAFVNGKGQKMEMFSEQHIFDFLGLKYLQPEERE